MNTFHISRSCTQRCAAIAPNLLCTQVDKKTLGQKTMLQEVKDLAEKRRNEDQTIHLPTNNFASRLTPDITFDDRHE